MKVAFVDQAIELLEKANADLEPELLDMASARKLLAAYDRAGRLVAFGVAALARKVDDPAEVARTTGTSMGKAKDIVVTGKVLGATDDLSDAFQRGAISLDQATEIARAEKACPGAAKELVAVAEREAFHVLRDKARKVKLEAEQHYDLAARQRVARFARTYSDELGMAHLHLAWEPHVGAPIVARAEAEAARRARAAKKEGAEEPFERHLADAYAALMSGSGKGRSKRPELVVLVSHEVAKRGWTDVQRGELCKIPGVGPIAPKVAREIAQDAFLTGVFYDGSDLRQIRRWSRSIPVEVAIALELGAPPGFDGISCIDCGNRFRTEFDHVEPRAAGGPTSDGNVKPRCYTCHRAKTERDRRAGKLKPPDP
ncbi:MAG TPA: HNH endonuclease signature motif containing protein [Actinomycetota bacterium]|nr:HNH endonuclease signature motif containing protein [Actinomycetota bacterium]